MSAAGSPFIASPGRVGSSGTSLQSQHQQDVPEEDATEIDFYVSEKSDTLSLSTGCSEDDRKSFVDEDEEKSFVDEDEDETAEIDFYISEKTDVFSLSSDGSAEDDMSIFVDDLEEFPEAAQSKEGGEGSELGNDGEPTSEAQGAPEESPDFMKSSMQGKDTEPATDSELTNDEQGAPTQQDLPVIAKASALTLPESAKLAVSTKDTFPAPSMASLLELENIEEAEETGSRRSNDSNARDTPKEGKAWCMVPDSVKKLFKRKSKSPPGSPSSSSSELPAFEAIVPEHPFGPEPQRSRSGRQQAWASEPDFDRQRQAFNGATERSARTSARTDEPQEADAPRVQGNQQATGSRSSSSSTFTLPRFGRSRPAQVAPFEE